MAFSLHASSPWHGQEQPCRAMHSSSTGTNCARLTGVYFVPAFGGLLAPHWRGDARGLILGLTSYTNKAHIVRALLQAICWQVYSLPPAPACKPVLFTLLQDSCARRPAPAGNHNRSSDQASHSQHRHNSHLSFSSAGCRLQHPFESVLERQLQHQPVMHPKLLQCKHFVSKC